MKIDNKPVFKFTVSVAIYFVVGLVLLGVGIECCFKSELIFGVALLFAGCFASVAGLRRVLNVFFGKVIVEKVVSLPLPGKAAFELTMPTRCNEGRVILFFERTRERYSGLICLKRVPDDKMAVASVSLPRLEPVFRFRVPKWCPTSDAGGFLEGWSRGTGQVTDPVALRFLFPVEPNQMLRLEFDLKSNFHGTRFERRFPISGSETIRVYVIGTSS